MKRLKYTYSILIAILLGFISFACSDDDAEQMEEKTSAAKYNGEPIETAFTVRVGAPDVTADVEVETRAGDDANIDEPKTENGGKFQNIVLVIADEYDKLYGIYCKRWHDENNASTSAGVTNYDYTFPKMKVNAAKARVYAFGNVDVSTYKIINGYTLGAEDRGSKTFSDYDALNALRNGDISVENESKLYNLRFKPGGGNYRVTGLNYNNDMGGYCTGMPVNGRSNLETVQIGETSCTVHMKRVCSRVQFKFRNLTGTYAKPGSKGNGNGNTLSNTIYVDSFVVKKLLATSAKYFSDGDAPTAQGTVDFDVLKVISPYNGNDHNNNKIANDGNILISMYVFETKGDYEYNIRVDKGKKLGQQVSTLEDGNAYIIFNNERNRVLRYSNNTFSAIENSNNDASFLISRTTNFYFYDQVFFQLEKGSADNVFALKTYPIDLYKNDKYNQYGNIVSLPYQGTTTLGLSFSLKQSWEASGKQYIKKEGARIIMCKSDGTFEKKYLCLQMPSVNEIKITNISESNTKNYKDWEFFSKYIIKRGKKLSDDDGVISSMERNHSYAFEFCVMTTDTSDETDLYVKSVRSQSSINWSETQK